MSHINELSFATIKSVLIFLIQPILHGKNNFGLKDLVPFMEITYQLFEVQGITENIDSLEFYCKIFMSIPAYSPEDYAKRFPDAQNGELCEFMSDFLYQILRLVIKNFNLIKYKDIDSNAILINLSNIFWPMVCNSSPQIIKEIINDLLMHIENDLEISHIHQLGDLLDCIVFSHSELILKHIIDLVSEKLLKPRESSYKEVHFLAEKSAYFEDIMKYQPSVANKATKKLWLTVLEKALTQGSCKVEQFEKEIQVIIMNYFSEEEDEIFDKTCDIMHTMIMTVLNIRPKNLQWQQGEFMR